eukprot:GHVU01034626.1.p1 GENE.GHVU01034626.1~~GHVU01034626.1.p1  ORF type:complete len:122 (-),score=7.48 GHVU01034626.1:250-615(-)
MRSSDMVSTRRLSCHHHHYYCFIIIKNYDYRHTRCYYRLTVDLSGCRTQLAVYVPPPPPPHTCTIARIYLSVCVCVKTRMDWPSKGEKGQSSGLGMGTARDGPACVGAMTTMCVLPRIQTQ